jgi:hypothetical protein
MTKTQNNKNRKEDIDEEFRKEFKDILQRYGQQIDLLERRVQELLLQEEMVK